jgi:CBS domain-containing protein
MKVKEIMTQSTVCCDLTTNVGAAVELMWVHNCGVLPVVGPDRKLEGVVTDRDICIAMGTRNHLPGDITMEEIARKEVYTCHPDDDIHDALQIMADRQVRRLPVVDSEGFPQGILSMDDVVAHTDLNKLPGRSELSSRELTQSLKKLYRQQFPMVQTKATAA